ncbi:MAG: DNA polymerase IV [Myxococcales bacterium]|nr:DNA polymerase IV [Myxococcales bacterium]
MLHIDMDAFFASVEQLDDPALRGRPVLVGTRSVRGVVAAASYEARRFGIRSAMPMVEALRRCPRAEVVPPHRERYVEVSRAVFAIFERYTPEVEALSIDEAFLDVAGSRALFGDEVRIASRIRAEIRAEIGIVASAGVAPNKFVAKVASALAKPDGLKVVAASEVVDFLAPLPVGRMWGVGPKAQARLHAAGLRTIGDLARASPEWLASLLGSAGPRVHALAQGLDARPVQARPHTKSLSAENTFERDLYTLEALEPALLEQAGTVAARLVDAGLWADTVTLKVKYRDHSLCTRQHTLREPVADTDSLYEQARALLARVPGIERGVRLVGLGASGLHETPGQLELFGDDGHGDFEGRERRERRERLERARSSVRRRFGEDGITRARLLEPAAPAREVLLHSTRKRPEDEPGLD